MKRDFTPLLLGRDLRSIARANEVVRSVNDQQSFDDLFVLLLHHDRLLVMRTADAIEKITATQPAYLQPHKDQLLSLLRNALDKELKWHLALLIPRVSLTPDELENVWGVLSYWLQNPNESKIVRVNSLQGLHELSVKNPSLSKAFDRIVDSVRHVMIPSLQARIKKLTKKKKK